MVMMRRLIFLMIKMIIPIRDDYGDGDDVDFNFQGWLRIWQASQLHHLPSRLFIVNIIDFVIIIFSDIGSGMIITIVLIKVIFTVTIVIFITFIVMAITILKMTTTLMI